LTKKTKLELTWVGKEERPRLEPRILLEDPALSYHAARRVTEADNFDNRLVEGDNLLALKALEQEFAGKVKCVFIDPPYNTGSAFTHYDDGVEHSLWLSLMRDRLEMLRRLLSEDGVLWVIIDDNEAHYLKVLCDEVFGRANFVANVIWQKKFSPQNDAKWLSDMHDHILVYAKNKGIWRPNRLDILTKASRKRKNTDDDPRGDWVSVDYTCNKNKDERPNLFYPITNPNTGLTVWPKETAVWRFSEDRHALNVEQGLVYWGKTGKNRVPRFKNFKAIDTEGQIPTTLWLHQEVGNNQEARKESLQFNPEDPFSTPKPERLMERVIQLSTQPGQWVLDSFAGSGTTGAVAHKMKRRWIMVEHGEHIHSHIIPRLRKVVDGTDRGGISQAVEWKGGGGFRCFRLAPTLLVKDKWGNLVINREYNPDMLAEAVCKHEGFTYAPSDAVYWQQGRSTERDFIYVTTQTLTRDQLTALSEEVGPERTLLVCCSAFRGRPDDYPNLTLKKLPNAVLDRCEWGRDDYSLQIASLPAAEPAEPAEPAEEAAPSARAVRTPRAGAPLFERGGES
jgi:adenine-specific DNA-methyltransferase